MRILLVGNYSLDRQTSMLRYADMLCEQMRHRGHEVEVIRPRVIVGGLMRRGAARKWLGYVDKYLFFPWELRRRVRTFDVVHVCDHSNSMYLSHTGDRGASITCHDMLAIESARGKYPQQKISLSGRVQQRWILKHLAAARAVVCVSAHTAECLGALAKSSGKQRTVILNAVNPGCGRASSEKIRELRERLGLGPEDRYLLHVGAESWYKNRFGALRIFQALRDQMRSDNRPGVRLVMAGQRLTAEMREFIDRELPRGSVIELVHPSDQDLWVLYSGAGALLFPSLYEGFGWPIIEAQRCGCPVIVSNRAPMTEVAGDAALYIDPADEHGAAGLIAAGWERLEGLKDAGTRNVERFEPSVVFGAYEEFFGRVAGSAMRNS